MVSKTKDNILKDYLDAFENPDGSFLYYYALGEDRTVDRAHFFRGEFFKLAAELKK
jgi:hypothetical protein